jgi:sugar phosphate isomerase/epimerase
MTNKNNNRPVVCFCSIAFRDEPIEQIIPKLARLGYDGVEIWGNHLKDKTDAQLDEIRQIATGCNLSIEVLSPYFWLTRDLPELIEESLQTAERFVGYARRLGARRIRTFVDAGNDGIGSAEATPAHWQRATELLKRITAMGPDLWFVMETHGCTLADTPESTQEVLKRVAAPNLKINYHVGGRDTLRGYRLLRSDIEHFHMQNEHGPEGSGYLEDGQSQLPPFFAELLKDGYTGSMSVEYCFSGATWDRAESARKWLRKHGL